MQTTEDNSLNTKLSAIDRALAAAKARKAAKDSQDTSADGDTQLAKAPRAKELPEAAKARREAASKELEEMRATRKAQRDAERNARKVARESAAGKPAHMKKIDNAAARLPGLNDQAQLLFNEATTNFSAEQVSALALHLQHFNRLKSTERALSTELKIGTRVRIVGGDPKFIGTEGTVSNVRRIRCFVDVPGAKKPIYLFTSDVEVAQVAETLATGTEG